MTYNTIYTIEEYVGQGFTQDEAPLAQEHDILFNKWLDGEITPAEDERLEALITILNL